MIKCLILMFLFHIIDDFYLQGWLANAKQKEWWKENAPDRLYKYDYLMALFIHSMSWSIMIMIPNMFSEKFIWWVIPVNLIIHAVTDNLKANSHKINLITDQSVHFIQIICTWIICYVK